MSSPRFELICAVILGIGQLCIMTGYDTESFLLESVIHSIHEREPDRIDSYAGYYGQAVLYAAFMITCILSPSILNFTSSKVILFLASCCFTSFPIGFLFTNSYYFYLSSIFVGIGFALFYQGQGGYLMSHSTRNTLAANNSISWAIGCCCMMFGGLIMAGITKMTAEQNSIMSPESVNSTGKEHRYERRFSDLEITLLFASLAGISFIGMISALLLPSNDVENCIENSNNKGFFLDTLKLTCHTIISPKMLQLFPVCALCGINISFWLSIFPTAMTFNMHNSNLIYLPAIYSFGAGLGEVIMGVLITVLSGKINDFGLQPTMIIGAILTTTYCMMILLSTPYDAPMRPTNKPPMMFHQTQVFIFILSVIVGLCDCCINSIQRVICALVMPQQRAQAYSVSKLYQAIASCMIYFLSPHLNIYYYTIGIPILAIFATVLFFQVAKKTQRMERKLTIEQSQKDLVDYNQNEKF